MSTCLAIMWIGLIAVIAIIISTSIENNSRAESRIEAKRKAERLKIDLLLEKRRRARQREIALDYDNAIRIWEELGEIKEAARVRKLKAEQGSVKVDQTVVEGDYVDDRDTIIKDSVLNRSNVGGKSKAEEIKEIKELLDSGAIDDDEFKQMKKEILGK